MKMIPGRRAELWIATDPRSRKRKPPAPVCRRVRILTIQGKGQDDTPESVGEIPLVLPFDVLQVLL